MFALKSLLRGWWVSVVSGNGTCVIAMGMCHTTHIDIQHRHAAQSLQAFSHLETNSCRWQSSSSVSHFLFVPYKLIAKCYRLKSPHALGSSPSVFCFVLGGVRICAYRLPVVRARYMLLTTMNKQLTRRRLTGKNKNKFKCVLRAYLLLLTRTRTDG